MGTQIHKISHIDLQAILSTATIEVDDDTTVIDYDNEGLRLCAYINNNVIDVKAKRELEDIECELFSEWYELSFKQKEFVRLHLIGEMERYLSEKEDDDDIVYNRYDEISDMTSDLRSNK